MAFYHELTTVKDVRETFLGGSGSGDDALILDFIRAASREMGDLAGARKLTPRIEARVFDVPPGALLMLDDDLLAVNTLTNGDSTAILAASYNLLTANLYPKWGIELDATASVTWEPSSAGKFKQVISVNGVWGFHRDYADAWRDTGNTVNGAHTNSTTSLAYSGSAAMNAGALYKIGSEILYHASGTSTPLTVVRGVNGSTAAAMSGGEAIYVWTPEAPVSHTARLAAAAYYRLRQNPLGDTVQIDDETFATPKDVLQYIKKRVEALGLKRL